MTNKSKNNPKISRTEGLTSRPDFSIGDPDLEWMNDPIKESNKYLSDDRYIIGCDISNNNSSYSSLCVMKGNEIIHTLTTKKNWKIKLVRFYYKYFKFNSLFIIENNKI